MKEKILALGTGWVGGIYWGQWWRKVDTGEGIAVGHSIHKMNNFVTVIQSY